MSRVVLRSMSPLIAFFAIMLSACEKEGEVAVPDAPAISPKMLVGDIEESILPVIHYKRITDSRGASLRGGHGSFHEIFELDALRYKPLATHWAGIKSLDPIPGSTDLYFRYNVIAELYADAETATKRESEFDAVYMEHLEKAGSDRSSIGKMVIPVLHFSHERVFYLFVTDMAASSNRNEAGKIKFGILKELTE